MSNNKHTARNEAIRDIKESLRGEHKCFIAFRPYLNPVMRCLVSQHLKEQKQIKSK